MSARLLEVEKLGPNVPGVIVIAVVAMLDLVVLALVLVHMLLSIALPTYASRMSSDKERNFLSSSRGLYIISLFIGNVISALGGVIEVEWLGSQKIEQGPTCSVQAFLFQLGGNASALWLGVISVSALNTFMFRARSLPTWAALLTIGILWTLMIIFDSVASAIFPAESGQFFYGIAGLWCWITPEHRMARLFTQYIWMWVWSLVSAVCFGLVFLCVRGNIVVKKDENGRRIKWNKALSGSWLGKSEEYEGVVGAVGKTMCWFPIGHIILMLPISVSRIAETFGFPVPVYALVFSAVNSFLLGILNTAIYFALRHSLNRGSTFGSLEDTLRGSRYSEKLWGTESFEAPQEKRPSLINKPDPPWTPTPTTKEWVPPSPRRGLDGQTSSPSSVVAYAVTNGDDGVSRSSIYSNAPPRKVPVSTKMAQRTRSFHRPMESISTVTSTSTTLDRSTRHLTPVAEGDSPQETAKPQLTIPPPALVARRQSHPSPNIISPLELDKLSFVPLSPDGRRSHKRSETDSMAYTGPRAISPDLAALVKRADVSSPVPSGPLPPPRKHKRPLTPSVPVDVDESDIGSVISAKSSTQEFDSNDTRPMSVGDITRSPDKRTDSMNTFWAAYNQSPKTSHTPVEAIPKARDTMRTFWAAYEGSSPKTPDMPPPPDVLQRDTMRSFWAAYEEPSPRSPNMPWPNDAVSIRSDGGKSWKSTATGELRHKDSNVHLRPSLSAVGRAPAPLQNEVPPRPPPKDDLSVRSEVLLKPVSPLRPNPAHRRSRSLTPMTTTTSPTSSPGMLRPATSAIARYGSPGLTIRDGPPTHRPTPSESSYRPPRPQPGYL